jgi:hypothetical protein
MLLAKMLLPDKLLVKMLLLDKLLDRLLLQRRLNNQQKGWVFTVYLLLLDALTLLPDMLLELLDKLDKLLHPDHAHENLDMDRESPVLLGQKLLWLDMDHELAPGNLLVLMPMPLGINIDMKGMLCPDGMCKNSERARLLLEFPPTRFSCLWVSRCC